MSDGLVGVNEPAGLVSTEPLPQGPQASRATRTQQFAEVARAAADLGILSQPLSDIAQLYARAGIAVFPVAGNKRPLVGGGFKARTTEIQKVAAWWAQWPEALIGTVPGDSELIAIDVDSKEAVEAFLAAGVITRGEIQAIADAEGGNDRPIPPGLVVATGGTSRPFQAAGFTLPPTHIYLTYDQSGEPPSLSRFAVQRHKRGYVIAPGSWRVEGGGTRVYRLLGRADPRPYPRQISAVTTTTTPPTFDPQVAPAAGAGTGALESTVNAETVATTGLGVLEGAKIPQGQRHALLRAASVRLARKADSEAEVLNALRLIDQAQCKPPIQAERGAGIGELRDLAASAWRNYRRENSQAEAWGDSPIGAVLATAGPATWGTNGTTGLQDSIRQFAAALLTIGDPVDRAIAFHIGKAALATVLSVAQRDAERILNQAMSHPAGDPEAPFGRAYTLRDVETHPEWLETPAPAIPYLAWPALKTLFSAREKAGKSTLAMAGAAAASSGKEFLGVQVPQRRVLWVSEEPINVLMRRAKGMEADPDYFVMLPMTKHPLSQVSHHARDARADIVVIDTLYRLGMSYVADENDSVQWGPVFDELDVITRDSRAVLLLAHSTKNSRSGEYRGSTAIGGFVDVIINMRTPDRDDLSRTLEAIGRIPTDSVTVKRTPAGFELIQGGKPKTTGSLEEQVVAFVMLHPGCTKTAIRKSLPFRNADVDAAIGRLIHEKRMNHEVSGGRNKYVVTPDFIGLDVGSTLEQRAAS
jgi:hypothetical protein